MCAALIACLHEQLLCRKCHLCSLFCIAVPLLKVSFALQYNPKNVSSSFTANQDHNCSILHRDIKWDTIKVENYKLINLLTTAAGKQRNLSEKKDKSFFWLDWPLENPRKPLSLGSGLTTSDHCYKSVILV